MASPARSSGSFTTFAARPNQLSSGFFQALISFLARTSYFDGFMVAPDSNYMQEVVATSWQESFHPRSVPSA